MSKTKLSSRDDLSADNASLKQSLLALDDIERGKEPAEEYDPDQTPANIDLAKKHGKAKMIYKFEKNKKHKGKRCICCGLPEEGGELLPLTCDPSALYHIGSGYVLYFVFFKHCIGMLVTITMVSGLYNLYTNYIYQDCADPATLSVITEDLCCIQGWVSNLSLASKKDHPNERAFQIQLGLLTVIALIIYSQSVRYKIRKLNEEVAETKISPADYTVMFTELPTDFNHHLSSDEGLKEWLEGMAQPGQPVIVKKIVRAYDVNEYMEYQQKKKNLEEKQKQGQVSEEKARSKQKKISHKMEELQNEGFKLTGIVFVSLEDTDQAQYIRSLFKKNRVMELLFKLKRIAYLFYWGKLPFDRDNIEAKKGPEPTDIEWGNLSYDIKSKLLRRFLIFLIMMTVVAIDFFIILQINIEFKELSFIPGTLYADTMNQFLNYLSATIVVCLDVILEKICLYLNSWEMHYAKSNFSKNAATRIAFYTALNLIVPVAMANIGNAFLDSLYPTIMGEKASVSIPWTIYGNGGMMQVMVFVFWFECFKNFGMNLFDPFYYVKIYQQKKAILTNGKGITQAEAHEIFEGPSADMERRHGGLVASMILTTFWAPALPIALIFTFVSIFLNYWADKYIFLRRMVLPNAIGPQITNRSLVDLEVIILIFTAGNVFFSYNIQSKETSPVLEIVTDYTFRIMTVIAILYKFILPVDWLNQLLFPVKKRALSKGNYDKMRSKFLNDYDIENPVTRTRALEELIEGGGHSSGMSPGSSSLKGFKGIDSIKINSKNNITELKELKKKSLRSQEDLL